MRNMNGNFEPKTAVFLQQTEETKFQQESNSKRKEESFANTINGTFLGRRRPKSLDLGLTFVPPAKKRMSSVPTRFHIKVPASNGDKTQIKLNDKANLSGTYHPEPEPETRRLNFSLLSSLRPRKSRAEKLSLSLTTTATAVTTTAPKTVKPSTTTETTTIKTSTLMSPSETVKTTKSPKVLKATATAATKATTAAAKTATTTAVPEISLPPSNSSATTVSFCVKLASLRKHSPKVITSFFGNENETGGKCQIVELPLIVAKNNGILKDNSNKAKGEKVNFCDRHKSRTAEKKSVAVSTCSCLKEIGAICNHHHSVPISSSTLVANGNSTSCSHLCGKKDVAVGTNDPDTKAETPDDEPYQRTAGDDLYLHSIVCIVIVLVVLAVGSAMMSSIQKILQNRALNRVHNFDAVNVNKLNTNYNPDGTIHDRLPFPKDLGAYMYDYMSEKETRKLLKKKKHQRTRQNEVEELEIVESTSSSFNSSRVEQMMNSRKRSLLIAKIVRSFA